jgi:hypothetical protein
VWGASSIRRIIGHETDAMFDRYRIVDQRDIDDAGVMAERYLQTQTNRNGTANGPAFESSSSVTNSVAKSDGEVRGAVTNCVTKLRGTEGNEISNMGDQGIYHMRHAVVDDE